MAWPDTDIDETHFDADSDSPSAARADLLTMANGINAMVDMRGEPGGPAGLDSNARLALGNRTHRGYGVRFNDNAHMIAHAPGGLIVPWDEITYSSGGSDMVSDPDSSRIVVPERSPGVARIQIGWFLQIYPLNETTIAYTHPHQNGVPMPPQQDNMSSAQAIPGQFPMVLAGTTKPITVYESGQTSYAHAEVGDYFQIYLEHDGSSALDCEGRFWMEILE